jgi:glycyl-tRNA synthetase beta chain
MIKDTHYYNNALLEIGTEELPVSCIKVALTKIRDFMLKLLETRYSVVCSSFQLYATSRKLVLIIINIQCMEHNNTKQINILLSKIFIDIICNISFSKTMIWNNSKFKFARPIRNIVALYGRQIVKLQIAEINSSRFSTIYVQNKIKIDLPENYVSHMKHNFIIIDQNKRCKLLKRMIKHLLRNIGTIMYDKKLFDEITYLVDYPYPILCSFNPKYLKLPHQILHICINNQKCFAILNKHNMLSNFFICVVNRTLRKMTNTRIIKNGYERVVESSLKDAQYFYNSDIQNKVIDNLSGLKNVIFYNKIGSVYEKIERIKKISTFLNKELFDMQVNNMLLKRAIELSKTDILSKLVFEYPELQGIAGKMYALQLGETTDVANSIEQHYWPINANSDKLPLSTTAIIMSLADRLDTLVASFTVGISSSGSTDPYSLRRLCIGFLKIIKKHLVYINLDYIIKQTFILNNNKCEISNITYNKLIAFIKQRLNVMLKKEGYGLKEIQAILNKPTSNLGSLSIIYNKLNSLNDFVHCKEFQEILLVLKRVNNVLKQALKNKINISTIINEDLFTNDNERTLYNEVIHFNMSITDYKRFFNELINLSVIINNFFSTVMVMDLNIHIKQNRLSLLNKARQILTNVIDFSSYL